MAANAGGNAVARTMRPRSPGARLVQIPLVSFLVRQSISPATPPITPPNPSATIVRPNAAVIASNTAVASAKFLTAPVVKPMRDRYTGP